MNNNASTFTVVSPGQVDVPRLKAELAEIRMRSVEAVRRSDYRTVAKLTQTAARINQAIAGYEGRGW